MLLLTNLGIYPLFKRENSPLDSHSYAAIVVRFVHGATQTSHAYTMLEHTASFDAAAADVVGPRRITQ